MYWMQRKNSGLYKGMLLGAGAAVGIGATVGIGAVLLGSCRCMGKNSLSGNLMRKWRQEKRKVVHAVGDAISELGERMENAGCGCASRKPEDLMARIADLQHELDLVRCAVDGNCENEDSFRGQEPDNSGCAMEAHDGPECSCTGSFGPEAQKAFASVYAQAQGMEE